MADDYTLSYLHHFQHLRPKDKPETGPGENVIQFILAYNSALFTHAGKHGINFALLMN